ncbi:MAG: hypothetical protein JSS04_02310 [Proteobacteria bacterium]|nr:hypothetical protein [Pseudomonadota bacterium]
MNMTKSILLAALLSSTLGGCGWMIRPEAAQAPTPSAAAGLESLKSSFVPYCGPVWSVGRQGYVDIPCPPGSDYPGALRM